MGLFGKKEEKKQMISNSLPDLPDLPELPRLDQEDSNEEELPKLPSYPTNTLGERFSQNAIKDAVSGEKDGDEDPFADEFDEEPQMMQEPLIMPRAQEMDSMPKTQQKIPREFQEAASRVKKIEPVFIRIDKFEDSLKIFQEAQEKVAEIQELLSETRKIKQKEEEELKNWEAELNSMKNQIEKVNKDIFSKVD